MFEQNRTKITGTSQGDQYTLLVVSRSFLHRMNNISGKCCIETRNIYFMFNSPFFRKSCRFWGDVENYCRAGQTTDDNMAHVRSVPDKQSYNYTHSFCVTLFAFPPWQWFHEGASKLFYSQIANLGTNTQKQTPTNRFLWGTLTQKFYSPTIFWHPLTCSWSDLFALSLVKPASNRFADRKFPSTSVEEILLHSHDGFALGQTSDALCFICKA